MITNEIQTFGLCDYCRNAERCEHKTAHRTLCLRGKATGEFGYEVDKTIKRKLRALTRDSKREFIASFKRVRPEQILIRRDNIISFRRLPPNERAMNSMDGRIERLPDHISFRKWCEQCGAEFETVNEHRHHCDACNEEIVFRLGWSGMKLDSMAEQNSHDLNIRSRLRKR